jgi:hypothetical protein
MSWKPVLLTMGNKPPTVKATVKDDMLKLQLSPEVAKAVGLTPSTPFTAFVGTAGEHGQVKITIAEDGGGRVKGGASSPAVYIPAEPSWAAVDDNSKCDFEIREEEGTLIVNLPWYTGQAPEILHGNQKLTATRAAKMVDHYRRGVSRRKLAEHYGVAEMTVVAYTNNPEDVKAHQEAVAARKASTETKALVGPPEQPTVTVCPPRTAYGVRKSTR